MRGAGTKRTGYKLVLVVMASIHAWFNLTCYHPPRGTPGTSPAGGGELFEAVLSSLASL